MISNQLLKAADAIVADRDSERDSRLVQQAIGVAKEGDPEGIHFLYVRFSPDVLHYVQSFVRDHHEAEDITQNVFAKLTTGDKKIRAARGPLRRLDPAGRPQRGPRPDAREDERSRPRR